LPCSLDETKSRKRLILSLNKSPLSGPDPTAAIFSAFIRLADILPKLARFRPEVRSKILKTRLAESEALRRADEDEKAEERAKEKEKQKRQERDAALTRMSATEQKKFLEKERIRDEKKSMKKMSKKQ
jgi:Protein of unknown function (DUF1682)